MILNRHPLFFRVILLGGFVVSAALAQQPIATLTGQVIDPSGALVTNATVTLHSSDSVTDTVATTGRSGRYTIVGLTETTYLVTVQAQGFALFSSSPIHLLVGKPTVLDVRLRVADLNELVIVKDTDGMDTDPNRNGDSLTLKGEDIDNLPLDPAELLQQLQALSGGPAPDLYVDGFSYGTLPPRDTIREIRINQNPYSAMYDTNPVTGRVEILTKPGTNKFHGDLYSYGNASALNTQNPFASDAPPYYSYSNNAMLDGPINRHASFSVNGGFQTGQDDAVINAQTLDAGNNQINLHQAISAPITTYNFALRTDLSLGLRNTLSTRYSIAATMQPNGGIGQLSLASQGFSGSTTTQILQLSDSTVVSPRIVNDVRFQYTRARDRQSPGSTAPTIAVAGAFTGGGNAGANYNDNQDRFELQDYVSSIAGKQFFTFGGRFRANRDANRSQANYNGTYTFASLGLNPSCTPLTTCNSYQATEQVLGSSTPPPTFGSIQAAGGGPSQFSITRGNPNVEVTLADAGIFLQDDWKPRSNLTLSGGLRFETQNHIADHADWAPRLGLAWALGRKGKPANYTIRSGAGIFYHRFASSNVLQATRQDGITQQQFIVTNPQFFNPVSNTGIDLTGAQSQSTIYKISPTFHAPYYIATTLSIERRVGSLGSVTAAWLTNRGDHTQLTRNINAPLPGTYNPAVPISGIRPYGGNQNIYEYDSQGVSRVNRLTTNFNLHFKNRLYLYGFYQFVSQKTDANETFVSNSYNIGSDYGRASTDIRHQASLVANAALPYGFRAVTFLQTRSGTPFNITVGQDLNGDSIFNDRPAFATDLSRPSVVRTRYGIFDTNPTTGQTIIPNNYGVGPALCTVNFDLNKSFHFGPEIAKAVATPAQTLASGKKANIDRRFSLDLRIDVQNLFNEVNAAPPIGTLNSPLFGRSIALANQSSSANRVIELSSFLRF